MLSFSPWDVLDEILNLIDSVSEGFPTYFGSTFNIGYDEICKRYRGEIGKILFLLHIIIRVVPHF